MDEVVEPKTERYVFNPELVPHPVPSQREWCLVVIEGPEKGKVCTLRQGSMTLGRQAPPCDFQLAGRGLSRIHARVTVGGSDEQVLVQDLDSTNGVFINGHKVERWDMKPGDTLTLGDVVLRLDATDVKIQELLQDLQQSANRDALTGAVNRRHFMERFEQECSATRRHALSTCVAMLDVDFFKKINDTYGHPAGDAVLVELSRRLHEAVRTEDVVARFGGEEFVLMLPLTSVEGGMKLLERIRESVAEHPFQVPTPQGEQSIRVTLSAGLAVVGEGQGAHQVLEQADVRLYQAKQSGRNRVVGPENL